jgi:hypothetical protein
LRQCGRYGRWSRRQRIEDLLGIEPSGLDDFPDRYNITPGVEIWIARAKDGKPALYSYLWRLVPYWSKDLKKGARPVNARAETAHETPMFKKLVREASVSDPRELVLRVEGDAGRETALLHPDGGRIAVLHRRKRTIASTHSPS